MAKETVKTVQVLTDIAHAKAFGYQFTPDRASGRFAASVPDSDKDALEGFGKLKDYDVQGASAPKTKGAATNGGS